MNRAAYIEKCERRWHGECLSDARRNWNLFHGHHEELTAILLPYLRDPGVQDVHGKFHNPDYTLTSWLWKCSEADENRWIWDFCEHYQTCHLRRGLIAYCEQLLRDMETPAPNLTLPLILS